MRACRRRVFARARRDSKIIDTRYAAGRRERASAHAAGAGYTRYNAREQREGEGRTRNTAVHVGETTGENFAASRV